MMINKRLIRMVGQSRKYIGLNVAIQWLALLTNMGMMTAITWLLGRLAFGNVEVTHILVTVMVALVSLLVRWGCSVLSSRMGFLSSKAVKQVLREKIYSKLLGLGASYGEQVRTSEVVQVAVEGVEQLETYFGAYLPQFFYAMLAPLTLFVYLSFVSLPSAVILLVAVPLIPVTIAGVQTWAKKLLSKYWGQYTALGDTFLENLQGLTTLKIYQADQRKHQQMNAEAEQFRVITMKVLSMQLNSITIMDLIAYGGMALGAILALSQYAGGKVELSGCLLIMMLSADFFIPMRQLGSFFHVAMNGMAASDKIFNLLDLPEKEQGQLSCPENTTVMMKDLCFSYEEDRQVLGGITMSFPKGSFTAIVGESGCGKSTVAGILMGRNLGYSGSVTVGGVPLRDIQEKSLMENFTYVSHKSHLFKGTVRENLLLAKPGASAEELWAVLERVNLADFLRQEKGLDTHLTEGGGNFSGGQCQRMALARALLYDSPVYIFDEATSNIDVESENDIMAQIQLLAKTRTVILISHRLANVVGAENIYVMEAGMVRQSGNHETLLECGGPYAKMWKVQQELEHYRGGEEK